MNASNTKIKIEKELLKDIYINLNSDMFIIYDDTDFYDDTMLRQINYLPKRLPFSDCLYIELMNQ